MILLKPRQLELDRKEKPAQRGPATLR